MSRCCSPDLSLGFVSNLLCALVAGSLLSACSAPPPAAAPPSTEAKSTARAPVAEPEGAPSAATPALDASRQAAVPVEIPKDIQELVAAADRDAKDRQLDAGRHPGELLTFFDIKPGMQVAELGAGTGYTAELLARRVGPKGKVYAQNPKFVLEKFAEQPWSERLLKPVMRPVVRVDREFDSPLPKEAKNLDAVLLVLFYHDTYWMGVDREQLNAAVFAALKPGGVFGVVDHSAAEGHADQDVKTLHRIEQKLVLEEMKAAGFELEQQGFFLRNPSDTLDWSASPSAASDRRGTSDRFVLKFKKPAR